MEYANRAVSASECDWSASSLQIELLQRFTLIGQCEYANKAVSVP